jgi:hypothetical protein
MMSLNLRKGRTWIVTLDGREIDCYVRGEQVFYLSTRLLGYQDALRLQFDDFDSFFVRGKQVSCYAFHEAVLDTKFSKKYMEQLYQIWLFSDAPVQESTEASEKTVCSALVSMSEDDLQEGAAPIELTVDDGTLVLHRGIWHEECWYDAENLYYWGYDRDGYEVAMCVSIYDVDLTYVNGWSFSREQVVEYFGLYRMTLERELSVAPLIISHYDLEIKTLEFVPTRFFMYTEAVAELVLSSSGDLTFRYPYSSEYLSCSVFGTRVFLAEGTEVLDPKHTLVTMFKGGLTEWLVTLSLVLKGSYS